MINPINTFSKNTPVSGLIRVPEFNSEKFQGAIKSAQSVIQKSVKKTPANMEISGQTAQNCTAFSKFIKQQAKTMLEVGKKESLTGNKFNTLG